MKKATTSNRLQRNIIILTLCLTLGIGIIFSAVCSSLYRTYLETSIVQSTDTNLKLFSDSIDSHLESIYQLIRWCQVNTTIGEYVAAGDSASYGRIAIEAQERLNEEYQSNPSLKYIHRVVVGNNADRYIQVVPTSYSSSANLALEIPKLSYFDTLMDADSYDFSLGLSADPFYKGKNRNILPALRPVYSQYSSQKKGWVYLQIEETLFTSPLEYYSHPEDANLYLILGEHTYRLSETALLEITPDYTMREEITNEDLSPDARVYNIHHNSSGQDAIIIVRPLSYGNGYVAQTISAAEMKNQYRMLYAIWIVILGLLLLIGLILTFALHHYIAVPVQKIQLQLQRIAQGNFSKDTSIEWRHELGDIGRGINTMAADMEQLIESRIADEKEKKDLEYKVLQNQINPHFLYNTLNSIKWMATVQGADGIADMTTSLSRLLRSISKGTKLQIPLSEEISLVKDYFNIQKYRYGGAINMEILCKEEALLSYSIIKFTLQPMIENAIFHGLEPKGSNGQIKITIQSEEKNPDVNLEIIIWDNGVGMSPEKIDKLLLSSDSSSEFFKELGVFNVHNRLQYEYGSEYGLRIESKEGEFTAIHILIPKRMADY